MFATGLTGGSPFSGDDDDSSSSCITVVVRTQYCEGGDVPGTLLLIERFHTGLLAVIALPV